MAAWYVLRFLIAAVAGIHAGAADETAEGPRPVYSIGDLHGDFDRFKIILQKIGLAKFGEDDHTRWTGGRAVLVSTGDSVDRGDRGRSIYVAFQNLTKQAEAVGGEVVNIAGNHELMNLQGDLRYVDSREMSQEGEYGGREQRQREWSKDGLIGADIRKRFVAAAVREGSLFVHGGLDPSILQEYGTLEAVNSKVKELFDREVVTFNHRLLGQKGPFWYRFLAEGPEPAACGKVRETLELLGARRMVVGHTPQMAGVDVRCATPRGPELVLADTVISRAYEPAFGFSRPSAVEYLGDAVTALYFPEGHAGPPERRPLHAAPTVAGGGSGEL